MKDFHAFILEGSKRNELGTCDSDDEMPKGKLMYERIPLVKGLCSL